MTDAGDFLGQLVNVLNHNTLAIAELARRLDRYETRDLVASLNFDVTPDAAGDYLNETAHVPRGTSTAPQSTLTGDVHRTNTLE
jgi:hypothetical protein